jgi:hypothetical protein
MKKLFFIGIIIASLLGLSACDKLDVIGEQSEKSFEAVLSALPDKVSEDTEFGGWSFEAPDGEAKFEWSKNFSKTTPYDVKTVINAQPFLDAGLDPAKLPEGMLVNDKIIVGTELGQEDLTYVGAASPLDSYKKLVKHYRYNITYHAALDHFGVALGNGNMFEWAKDMKTNDKDIVFALNPQPFLDAGVNPDKVAGWKFAKVQTMDENGKKIQVDKFLKPFDVES